MQCYPLGTSLILVAALLACKGGSGSEKSDPAGAGASSTASSTRAEPVEKLDKAAVCGLYGGNSGSDACSDCVDEAEMSDKCSRKGEAWERCAGDVETIGASCAGSCVNQCVAGEKACCECAADCIDKKRASCLNQYLAYQKCAIASCKKACG